MLYPSNADDIRGNIIVILNKGFFEYLISLGSYPSSTGDLSSLFQLSNKQASDVIVLLNDLQTVRIDGEMLSLTDIGFALNHCLMEVLGEILPKKMGIDNLSADDIGGYSDRLRSYFNSCIDERGFDSYIADLADNEEEPSKKSNARKFFELISVFSSYPEFFVTHDYSLLPDFAIRNLGSIRNSSLVCDPPVNYSQGFNFYLDILKDAGHIHGISTWSNSEIASVILERIVDGAEVGIVLSEKAADSLMYSPVLGSLDDYHRYDNFNIYVTEQIISVGLTVTDRTLSVGMYLNDDYTYDSIHDFISSSKDSLCWGEELYEYYKERSVPLVDYILKSD